MPEAWLPIEGFEGRYEVSNWGRVKSLDHTVAQSNKWGPMVVNYKGRMLKTKADKSGYMQVTLSRGAIIRQCHVHVLVASQFIGQNRDGLYVLHHDGNRLNCMDTNLYYGTAKQNSEDAILHGVQVRGERQGQAKLTDDAVREIRFVGAATYGELADRFGVSKSAIARAARGETWRHVGQTCDRKLAA